MIIFQIYRRLRSFLKFIEVDASSGSGLEKVTVGELTKAYEIRWKFLVFGTNY